MTEHDESGERRRCYSLQEHVETLLDMLGLPHEVVDNERCEALQTAVYALKKRAERAEAEIARLREALDEREKEPTEAEYLQATEFYYGGFSIADVQEEAHRLAAERVAKATDVGAEGKA